MVKTSALVIAIGTVSVWKLSLDPERGADNSISGAGVSAGPSEPEMAIDIAPTARARSTSAA